MFAHLLDVAAQNSAILGLGVTPHPAGGFEIHLWVGLSLGERFEWFEAFDKPLTLITAADQIAERALVFCRLNNWGRMHHLDSAPRGLERNGRERLKFRLPALNS